MDDHQIGYITKLKKIRTDPYNMATQWKLVNSNLKTKSD